MTESELAGILQAHRIILRMILKMPADQSTINLLSEIVKDPSTTPILRAEIEEVINPGQNPRAVDLYPSPRGAD